MLCSQLSHKICLSACFVICLVGEVILVRLPTFKIILKNHVIRLEAGRRQSNTYNICKFCDFICCETDSVNWNAGFPGTFLEAPVPCTSIQAGGRRKLRLDMWDSPPLSYHTEPQ